MPIPATTSEITVEWLSGMLPNADLRSIEVRRIAEDRGATGQIHEVDAALAAGNKHLVVKTPRVDQWERSLREIRLLETLDLPIHTARIISSETEGSTKRSALVLSRVVGDPGDAAVGTTPARLEALVHDLALLHSTFRSREALEKLTWLPQWGQGTADSARPFQRRSDRYRNMVEPFLAEHGSSAPGWAGAMLRGLAPGLEERLGLLSSLAPTLIHADAHLDNIVFRKDHAHWLDWQSASRGPGLYDLTRLLSETIDITVDLPLSRRLAQAYRSHLAWHGMTEEVIDEEFDHLPDMAVSVLVGFVSSYGNQAASDLSPRERGLVAKAVSERGLFGFVRHLLGS